MSGTIDLSLVDGDVWAASHVDLLEGYISHGGDFGAGAPSGTPADGSTYFNTTAHTVHRYINGTWRTVHVGGGVVLSMSATAIVTTTVTPLGWGPLGGGTVISNPDSWALSNQDTTLTVPTGKGGRYVISYVGTWASSPGAGGDVALQINGTYVTDCLVGGSNLVLSNHLTILRTLAAGDEIKFYTHHVAGADRTLTSRLEIAAV